MSRSATCIVLMLIALTMSGQATARSMKMTLKQALAKRMVSLVGLSQGGYLGRVLNLKIFNHTPLALEISVDPGLIFKPADTSYQNLVAVGEEQVEVAPKANAEIKLQTFCGKSYARGPRAGLDYKFWKQGDSAMIKVSQYIKKNSLYNYAGQHAIWSLTNGHSVSNIYDQTDASKKLALFVAAETGKKAPKFYTKTIVSEKAGAVVYSPTVEKYYVDLEWQPRSSRNMHVYVVKHDGALLWEQTKGSISSAGHRTIVELDPKYLKKGRYFVQLKDDDNFLWRSEEVIIE